MRVASTWIFLLSVTLTVVLCGCGGSGGGTSSSTATTSSSTTSSGGSGGASTTTPSGPTGTVVLQINPSVAKSARLAQLTENPRLVVKDTATQVRISILSQATRLDVVPPTIVPLTGQVQVVTIANVPLIPVVILTEALDAGGTVLKAGTTSTTVTLGTNNASVVLLPIIGAPATLQFSAQPGGATQGAIINPNGGIQVVVLDGNGNQVSSVNETVTLSIGTNAGGNTTKLSGTLTETTVNGVATFSGLSINNAGNGYTLLASADDSNTGQPLAGATSNAFNIAAIAPVTDTPVKLQFSAQPTNTTQSLSIDTPGGIQVSVLDASNNVFTRLPVSVTLAIGTNPAAGTLSGTLTQTTVNGVATFNGLSINNVGTGYTLVASANDPATNQPLTATTSTAFSITATPPNFGTPTQVGFLQPQPPNTLSQNKNTQFSVTVAVEDVNGNTVSNINSGTITVAIGTNPAGGTLTSASGHLTLPIVNGVVTFPDLSIDNPSVNPYTLVATTSIAGLTQGTSGEIFIINNSGELNFAGNGNGASQVLPAAIAESASGNFLFVANNNSDNVSVFSIGAGGSISEIGGSPFSTGGSGPSAIAIDNTNSLVYVADAFSGDIAVFSLTPATGALTLDTNVNTTGGFPTAMVLDSTNSFLMVTEAAAGKVELFDTVPATPTLNSEQVIAAQSDPESITIDPSNSFVYVANANSNSVSAYVLNAGVLTANGTTALPGQQPLAVLCEPSGKYVYVVDALSNQLVGFDITAGTGVIGSQVPNSPYGIGTNPLALAVDPHGKFLYVAETVSDQVEGFNISAVDGSLSALVGSPYGLGGNGVTNPSSLVVDPLSRFLFTANSLSNNVSVFSITP